jgi:hypothetical protein
VIIFTILPLYPWGNSSRHPLDRRMDVMEKRKITCPYRKSNPNYSIVEAVTQSLHRLSYPGNKADENL